MPLFFFVSGFVLYKSEVTWNIRQIFHFLQKKISVQIISPLIFFFACMYLYDKDFIVASYSGAKEGYWFTFVLFEFYIFYILFFHVIHFLEKKHQYIHTLMWIIIGLFFYIITLPTILVKLNMSYDVIGLFSIVQWKYFLFFILGTLVRKYFDFFEYALDRSPLILFAIIVFFTFNICSDIILGISNTAFYLLTTLSGLILVFSFFRKNQNTFSRTHLVGRIFQYIGKRTLDVYLIHFFFVYSNMQFVFPDFGKLQTPFPEFLFSLIIGGCIIAASLVVSHVLRLSPALAHFLFGVKKQKLHNQINA